MHRVDILIVGAGVIGLAIARELAEKEKPLLVLEKNKSFGQETSSRNSEVIHGGMYYPTGTLKAKLCIEGRHLLYELCQKHKIPYKKIGKLIVATEKEEASSLDRLLVQGKTNGANELKIINQKKLNELEPNISGITALCSPETGIIDSHRFMEYLLDDAKNKGAMVVFNSEVVAIEKLSDGYRVSIKNGSEMNVLKTQIVINSAGLDSDVIAEMAGIDIEKSDYRLHYCKGQYFRVNGNKSSLVNRLIYPVPKAKSGGLGIHATLDLGGSLRLGPDDKYLDNRNKDYSVDDSKKNEFYLSVKKIMPFIEESDLSPDTAGIRPKLQGPGGDSRDFVIQDESIKGFSGFINLIGIESPGLTASLAIARLIDHITDGICN